MSKDKDAGADATSILRIPRREKWLALPEEYPGLQVRVWVNCPYRELRGMDSGDPEEMKAALLKIVLEHNGWCDQDGQPFPPASDPAFWEDIPTELAATVIALVQAEAKQLPNSILSPRRR